MEMTLHLVTIFKCSFEGDPQEQLQVAIIFLAIPPGNEYPIKYNTMTTIVLRRKISKRIKNNLLNIFEK